MPYVRALGEKAGEVLAAPIDVSVCAPALATYVHATEQLVTEILVRSLATSIDFYTRFGFAVLRTEPTFAELAWEGHRLFLDQRPDLPPPPSTPQANMRIRVPEVDAFWAAARLLDLPVVQPIADREYGLRDFTILDPDGFGVRFASRLVMPQNVADTHASR